MRRIKGRRLLIVGVLLLALGAAGAGAALAASSSGSGHPRGRTAGRHHAGASHAVLAAAASYLGMTPSQLRQQLRGGKTLAELATSSGHTEAGLIQALVAAREAQLSSAEANVQQRVTALVRGHHDAGVGRGAARPGLGRAARNYLGLSGAQLRQQRTAGKTLGQIADATPGKSEAGLIEALITARKQRVAAATAAGLIPVGQVGAIEARIPQRVKALVDRVPALRVRHPAGG